MTDVPLSAYAGIDRQLFDDRIDPIAVGVADVTERPKDDPLLRKRAQRADAVARLKVSTVTVDAANGTPVYHVTLQFVGAPLAQHRSADGRVDLTVRSESPSFGIVKWLDARLIGRTFIGFVRQFAGAEEAELHFHLSADDPEVAAAVREATTLGELTGP
jgi:hypothetical protein